MKTKYYLVLATLSFFLSCKKELQISTSESANTNNAAVALANSDFIITASTTGYIYALNATTGVVKWKYLAKGEFFRETPCVKDSIVYLKGSKTFLYAINIYTGIPKYIADLGKRSVDYSSICISNDNILYVGKGQHLLAVNAADGSIRFDTNLPARDILSSPTVVNGSVYVAGGNFIFALNALTGVVRWSYLNPNSPGAGLIGSPSVKNGLVYYSNYTQVYGLDTADGSRKWLFETQYPESLNPFASTTYDNGVVYAQSVTLGNSTDTLDAYLYAIDATNGSVAWKTRINTDNIDSLFGRGSVFAKNNKVFIPLFDSLVAVNTITHQEIWSCFTGKGPRSLVSTEEPCTTNNIAFIAGMDHKIHAISIATGVEIWSTLLGNPNNANYQFDYQAKIVIVSGIQAIHSTVSGMTQ